MAINTDDLSGIRPSLRVRKTVKLGNTEEPAEFGALWAKTKTIGETEYQLQGSFGFKGKQYPVLATLNDAPEQGQSGHAKPAIHVFAIVEGDLLEIAVGFKKDKDGKTYYSGETTGSVGTKAPLFFWPIDPKAPEGEAPESF